MIPTAVDAVFFDIGNTLARFEMEPNRLTPFPSSKPLLAAVQAMGLRIGIITTLGKFSDNDGRQMLADAGLDGFVDPRGFVSEHTAGAGKPDPRIYQFAAAQFGVPVDRCVFIGESLIEVLGAITAGMKGVLKPYPPGADVLF